MSQLRRKVLEQQTLHNKTEKTGTLRLLGLLKLVFGEASDVLKL